MHPHTFYSSLFDWEKRDEVFVIISFTDGFEPRWRDVIEPCIREDLGLKAVRVDEQKSGESIVHGILDGIAHARLVIADITSSPISSKPQENPRRSANVMWELGIAHVMRLPDEVVIVKSDNDASIFDLTQFRALQYDPADPVEARRVLAALARDRLQAVERTASKHVLRAASLLDIPSMHLLFEAASKPSIPHEIPMDGFTLAPFARVWAIDKLLELGLLRMEMVPQPTAAETGAFEAVATYKLTPFGREVFYSLFRQMGMNAEQLELIKSSVMSKT